MSGSTEMTSGMDECPAIVVAADNGYAMPLGVMLESLGTSLKGSIAVNVFILDAGIAPWNRSRINRIARRHSLNISWIKASVKAIKDLPVWAHIKHAAYLRILCPDLLPQFLSKVIYLDCDMIIIRGIEELWNTEMDGCPLAAVQEQSMVISSAGGVVSYLELGIPGDAKYLNSGVLIIDLVAWRRENFSQKIMDYLRKYREHVVYHDQDGLNAIFATRWKELDHRWNYWVNSAEVVPEESHAKELARICEEADIVHYASRVKPWHLEAISPGCAIFNEMVARTPWHRYRRKGCVTLHERAEKYANKYFIGKCIRGIPLVGGVWSKWRTLGKGR